MKNEKPKARFQFIGMAMLAILCAEPAFATILWLGAEDIDFPNGAQICTNTNGNYYRSGYARMGLYTCGGGIAQSNAFQAGGQTSLWISGRISVMNNWVMNFGLGKLGTGGSLWIGGSQVGGNWSQIGLWTYNSGTWTRLAYETGSSLIYGGVSKVDMQVISYGASGTVNVYVNGAVNPVITYTGNIVTGGNTNLDSVLTQGGGSNIVSELIVSTTDTRSLSLATMSPNGAGGVNQWTGTYANINPNSINDSNNVSDNNSGDVFQSALNNPLSGNFGIQAIEFYFGTVRKTYEKRFLHFQNRHGDVCFCELQSGSRGNLMGRWRGY